MSRFLKFGLLLHFFLVAVVADTQVIEQSSSRLKVETSDALLLADSVGYDHPKNKIYAQGHVEITYEKTTLFADRVEYDQILDTVKAEGNVWLVNQDGHVMQMASAELSGDLKNGVATAVRGIMADESLFAANRARRKNGTEERYDEAVYTPCKVCRSNPDLFPTWQLKSRHMVVNEESEVVTHADASLEFFGVPVFYTPYLIHPGPKSKRKSGFLTPFFGGSGDLGMIVGVPYYWAFAQDQDLTITPVYIKNNPFLSLKYRYRFCRGFLDIETSTTQGELKRGQIDTQRTVRRIRGHLNLNSMVKINNTWRTGINIKRVLDDTYLKRYKFLGYSEESFLSSRIYNEGFWDRNYALIQGLGYQSLRQGDRSVGVPYIVPSVDVHLLSKPQAWNGTYFLNANILNLQRKRGQTVQRFILEGGWKTHLIHNSGMISDFSFHMRGDLYKIKGLILEDQPKYSGQSTRMAPKAHYGLRYPLYHSNNNGRVIIEPQMGVILTPNNRNTQRIPNEDSALFELSRGNLFNPNRLAGYDFVDQWSRVNYGLRLAYFSKTLGNSEFFFGQSYSFPKVSRSLAESGLSKNKSDFVFAGKVNYSNWLIFNSQVLLKHNNFTARRHESTITLGTPIFRVNSTYIRSPKLSNSQIFSEQVTYGVSSQLTNFWSANMTTTKQLGNKKGGALAHRGNLIYQDECFAFTTSIVKTFYKDRDVKPALTVLFRLSFKNLGDVAISGDQFGLNQSPQQ